MKTFAAVSLFVLGGLHAAQGAPAWAEEGRARPAPNAWELFAVAEATPPQEGALLLCQVDLSPGVRWDAFADPDLLVRMRLGASAGYAEESVFGPENSLSALVTTVAPRVAVSDRLRLTVFDRDVTELEYVGAAEARATQWPLRLQDRHFRAECRLASRDQLEPVAAPLLARAQGEAARLASGLRVVLSRADLGYPLVRVEEAREQVRQASRLLGWEDARVAQGVAALEAVEERWQRAREQAVAKEVASLPAAGADVEVEEGVYVRVESASCSARRGCTLRLHLANATKEPLALATTPKERGLFTSAQLVGPRVGRLVYARSKQESMPPGAEREVALVSDCEGDGCSAVPPLLRLGDGGALLRLTK